MFKQCTCRGFACGQRNLQYMATFLTCQTPRFVNVGSAFAVPLPTEATFISISSHVGHCSDCPPPTNTQNIDDCCFNFCYSLISDAHVSVASGCEDVSPSALSSTGVLDKVSHQSTSTDDINDDTNQRVHRDVESHSGGPPAHVQQQSIKHDDHVGSTCYSEFSFCCSSWRIR